ncbi:MAG: alpha/beta fold hydrolase [Polaromonas sp.]|nr:alpha/beta fold hydrolase [Polaromonas sp.]
MSEHDKHHEQDYDDGMLNRRRVLGHAWVDKSLLNVNDFNGEFQNLITRYAWNEVWGRPAFGDKTRRLMVLSTMIALKAYEEFALHVRAGLDGPPESRLTPDDIKEVILQAAIYCGVPAANHAFSIAGSILREKGLMPSTESRPSPKLHWVREGQGPVVMLCHALGCDLSMWDAVAERLKKRFTVIRYDARGHGESAAPAGPYSMEMLADDAAALITAQAAGPVHFVGLSMGGMTAQALAARHPQLVKSITIANAANFYGEPAGAMWRTRMNTVLTQGVAAVAESAIQRWFTPEFIADTVDGGAARVATLREKFEKIAPEPYAASCGAVAAIDFRSSNQRITCPTLVIAGSRDEATPLALSEAIACSITVAQLVTLPAAHLSAVEMPQEFAALLETFIDGVK